VRITKAYRHACREAWYAVQDYARVSISGPTAQAEIMAGKLRDDGRVLKGTFRVCGRKNGTSGARFKIDYTDIAAALVSADGRWSANSVWEITPVGRKLVVRY